MHEEGRLEKKKRLKAEKQDHFTETRRLYLKQTEN